MGMYGMYGGGVLSMFIWPIILLIIGFFLFKWMGQQNGGQNPFQKESALDILQKRYARGEITREEYEEMRRNLH